MGCVCSCFHGSVTEESVDVEDRTNKPICLDFLLQGIKNKFEALFGNEGMHAFPSSDQITPTANTTPQADAISTSDSNAPSNLPNSSSFSISQLQLNVQVNPVIVNGEAKVVASIHDKDLKDDLSASHEIVERAGLPPKYMFPSSEEEDECPTCLEEYTSENPKIFTQCQHYFHLPCIYEWMERSETCPVCMKLLTFSEQP